MDSPQFHSSRCLSLSWRSHCGGAASSSPHSSGLRFSKTNQAVRHGLIGKVTYAETYGPCEIEPHHPDLFWYGVHGVEALFTVMGPGCESVQRGTTPDGKIEVTGIWSGNRKGIYREEDKFHGLARGRGGCRRAAPASGGRVGSSG